MEIAGAPQGFVVYAPESPEAVLDDTARDYARRPATATWFMPYWATPWASGIAAAEAVVADPAPFSSRRVIELGCGLGITAMALAEVGARLVLVDVWPESLAFARFNAVRQGGPGAQVRPLLADWRTAAGADLLLRSGPFDAVVAADVLYEADDVAPLFDLVPRLVRPGAPLHVDANSHSRARRRSGLHSRGYGVNVGATNLRAKTWIRPQGA